LFACDDVNAYEADVALFAYDAVTAYEPLKEYDDDTAYDADVALFAYDDVIAYEADNAVLAYDDDNAYDAEIDVVECDDVIAYDADTGRVTPVIISEMLPVRCLKLLSTSVAVRLEPFSFLYINAII
jgi:hypothetical protein